MTDSKPKRVSWAWLEWLALAIALSPVLVEWWTYAWAPDTRFFPLVLPLVLILWARGIEWPSPPRSALGTSLILIGLGLEIVGILAQTWTVARVAAPIAVIGMAMRLGNPSPRLLTLLFFAVPIPTFVMQSTTPQLESFYAAVVSQVLAEGLGFGVTSSGPLLIVQGQSLELTAPDAGWQTAFLLMAGLWTLALVRGWSISRVILVCVALPLTVPALQIGAVGVAGLLLISGLPDWGTAWLRWVFYLTLFVLALFFFRGWRPARKEPASPLHTPAP